MGSGEKGKAWGVNEVRSFPIMSKSGHGLSCIAYQGRGEPVREDICTCGFLYARVESLTAELQTARDERDRAVRERDELAMLVKSADMVSFEFESKGVGCAFGKWRVYERDGDQWMPVDINTTYPTALEAYAALKDAADRGEKEL